MMIAPNTKKSGKPTVDVKQNIQIKIALRYIKPPIWRRVIVPDNCTLAKLHDIMQLTMGWQDCHLHAFEVAGERFTGQECDPENEMGMENESSIRLSDIVRAKVKKFGYEYDFGDGWLHEITVEKVLPIDPSTKHPVCTGGARACPPEDCGSYPGYGNILKALIVASKSEEQKELLEWLGDGYDPEYFDLDAVNSRLKKLKV